jgi:CubicO group peptidase (beta-lactamase class C family)
MMLVEDGKLLLEDEVSRYLPEFKDVKVKLPSGELVAPESPLQIHHLIKHTSGVSSPEGRRDAYPSLEAHILDVAKLPLQFHPGERYKYPESTEVLGRVIEVVSGQTLRQFLKDRVLDPLGMVDTDFGIAREKAPRKAISMRDGEFAFSDPEEIHLSHYYSARGGLDGSATDYWKFCQMLLNNGKFEGKRLLGRRTVQRMLATKSDPDNLPGWRREAQQMTLGFRVVTKSAQSMSPLSNGAFVKGGAGGTYCFVDASEELIGILMTQSRNRDRRMVPRFQELIYAAIAD